MTIIPKPFYFMRHGETDWNRKNKMMGQADIPLNEHGIQQAHKARQVLQRLKVEKIYTSPLKRALRTAEIVNQTYQYPMITHPGLMESYRGEDDDIEINFEQRVLMTVNEILEGSVSRPLLVSHGGIGRVLTQYCGVAEFHFENCACYFFRPPVQSDQPWFICNIDGDNTTYEN